jgi:hypothetical protein
VEGAWASFTVLCSLPSALYQLRRIKRGTQTSPFSPSPPHSDFYQLMHPLSYIMIIIVAVSSTYTFLYDRQSLDFVI